MDIRVPGSSDDFSIGGIVAAVGRQVYLLLGLSLVLGLAAYGYARTLTPLYRADVLVAPNRADTGATALGGLAAQLGSLGGLAGIGGLGSGQSAESIALLRSRTLAARFIDEQGLLVLLFPDREGIVARGWQSTASPKQPTMAEATTRFLSDYLEVTESKVTGLVTISVYSPDRTQAALLANGYVATVNSAARAKADAESAKSIELLGAELGRAGNVDVRSAIAEVLTTQITRRTLASARTDFAFRIVDEAIVPDAGKTARPRRALIGLIGCAVGFLIGFVVVLARVVRAGRRADASPR